MIDPRERINEGLNRERVKMELKRGAAPAIVFVVGLVVALAIFLLLITNISQTFGSKTYEVRFEVDTAFGVFEGFDQVRFLGVPAGTITKIEREGDQLVLVAKLKKEYGPIYRDARATVRPITPLNDVYLDIVEPGSADAGEAEADEPLPQAQTTTSVTVPDVLDTLRADQRVCLQRVLDQLGNGLADGGLSLRRAFIEAAPFLERAGVLTDQIALRERQTKRLITNATVLTNELGRREREIRRLVSAGAASVETLQDGSADLDATLAELGPTFTDLRTTLANVRGVVDDLDAGVTSLYPLAERLPQNLRAVRALNRVLEPAVTALDPPVRRIERSLVAVLADSKRGTPAFKALTPQVPVVNRLVQRLVDCEKGVIGFFQWNASLSKYGDSTAPIPRGNLAIGPPDLGLPGVPRRQPEPACTPGFPPRAIPSPKDLH